MSIPLRFDVYLKDGSCVKNRSFGTASYGTDLSRVDFWFSYLRRSSNITEDDRKKFCPWLDDVDYFYIPMLELIIKKKDL